MVANCIWTGRCYFDGPASFQRAFEEGRNNNSKENEYPMIVQIITTGLTEKAFAVV